MTVPWPPGSPDTVLTAQQAVSYIGHLGPWVDDRRRELDRLDQRVRTVAPQQGTHDMAMTLTVWQAIKERYEDVFALWDSGRVGEIELKKITAMIWGNLNDMLLPGASLSSGGGIALSLPEACRMLEALISQLSSRYQLAPVPTQATARIAQLRAQVERIREQAIMDSAQVQQSTLATVTSLAGDVEALVAKADRGGDIGGILGPLEVRAARLERDLIVSHAERQALDAKIAKAKSMQATMLARSRDVAELVAKVQASLTPAPRYAVPNVAALGEVPTTAADLDAYLTRLTQVGRALDVVVQANLVARSRRDSLIRRVATIEAGHPTAQLTQTLIHQVTSLLASSPAPLDVIEPMVVALEASGRSS